MPVLETSVIIVNYNGARWLPGCLAAVTAQEEVNRPEIVVVDNGSSDESVALVREQFPPTCTSCRSSGTSGSLPPTRWVARNTTGRVTS